MPTLDELLYASATLHQHACPRQVLGARMGLMGGHWLGLEVPQEGKRLLTLVETDGCAADGIAVATGCWVGRRTLRVVDFGKVAATFVDTHTERAVRVIPRTSAREDASIYAPDATNRWEAYLLGYQRMPELELLLAQEVELVISLDKLLSKPDRRVVCEMCREEIINEREVLLGGMTLCQACAGLRYYRRVEEPAPLPVGTLTPPNLTNLETYRRYCNAEV